MDFDPGGKGGRLGRKSTIVFIKNLKPNFTDDFIKLDGIPFDFSILFANFRCSQKPCA